MKVAFVYPEVYDIARFGKKRKEFPPFGVLYLATIISQQNDMNVQVFSIENSDDSLDLTGFDAVAFSIPSSVTYDLIKAVRFNSKYNQNALLIGGGVHVQIFPEQSLLDLNLHAVSIGQGDETILELLERVSTKEFFGIDGIFYQDQDGKVISVKSKVLKKNLDHLPVIPARELLPGSDFILKNRLAGTDLRMTHVMFGQGCPFTCNFCASQQQRMQYRSGWHVRQELEHLKKMYDINGFAIVDDNFTVNKRKAREICKSITDLNLKWSVLSRVDTVDYDLLEIMADAGCIEIKFGIESGSDAIIEAMGKGVSVDQIYNAVRMTYSVGIGVKAFIIHGYPGENMETTQETIKMLDDLSDMIERVSLFRFVPLPGSRVWVDSDGQLLPINDMAKCYIHHNPYHWWGSDEEFAVVEASYKKLNSFILSKWG